MIAVPVFQYQPENRVFSPRVYKRSWFKHSLFRYKVQRKVLGAAYAVRHYPLQTE